MATNPTVTWKLAEAFSLPAPETPVLIVRHGVVRIGELRWDRPGHEDTYRAYLYWDDPFNDGQCWEHDEISHWAPMPALP